MPAHRSAGAKYGEYLHWPPIPSALAPYSLAPYSQREETVRLVGTANPGNRFTERYYDNNRVEQSIVVRRRE
jgi:hypothetical protein